MFICYFGLNVNLVPMCHFLFSSLMLVVQVVLVVVLLLLVVVVLVLVMAVRPEE